MNPKPPLVDMFVRPIPAEDREILERHPSQTVSWLWPLSPTEEERMEDLLRVPRGSGSRSRARVRGSGYGAPVPSIYAGFVGRGSDPSTRVPPSQVDRIAARRLPGLPILPAIAEVASPTSSASSPTP